MSYPEFPNPESPKEVTQFLKEALQRGDSAAWNAFLTEVKTERTANYNLTIGNDSYSYYLYIEGLNVRAVDFQGFDLSEISFVNMKVLDSNIVGADFSDSYIGQPLDGTVAKSRLTGAEHGNNSWNNNMIAHTDLSGLIVDDLFLHRNTWHDTMVLEQAKFVFTNERHQTTDISSAENYAILDRSRTDGTPGRKRPTQIITEAGAATSNQIRAALRNEEYELVFPGEMAMVGFAMGQRTKMLRGNVTIPSTDVGGAGSDNPLILAMEQKRDEYDKEHKKEGLKWHREQPVEEQPEVGALAPSAQGNKLSKAAKGR